jgi:hypothetical protein
MRLAKHEHRHNFSAEGRGSLCVTERSTVHRPACDAASVSSGILLALEA